MKFIRTAEGSLLLLSGSADKCIRSWEYDTNASLGFKTGGVIATHESSINCIAGVPLSDFFVSGAAEPRLKVWRLLKKDTSGFSADLLQTISISPAFLPLSLSVARLNKSAFIIAVAGTQTVVQLYAGDGNYFKIAATLKGHEGWIRALDFAHETLDASADLILASASQDKYIRLWRIQKVETQQKNGSSGSTYDLLETVGSLSNKSQSFEIERQKYSVSFEALLLGHDDWIHSASWRSNRGKLQLLSASHDNSLAIWEADAGSSVWVCLTRLGEISALKGATTATGSTGGFWIGLWSPAGDTIVSLGRTGSWRLWNYEPVLDKWSPGLGVGGHTRDVKDIAWSSDGSYLLSTSLDQTTRLHAPWKRLDQSSWHEFSRPQIHGYDLNCIDTIGTSRFISGADEKLLRVFRRYR